MAITLNLGGGVLLLLASVKLIQTYFRSHSTDDLLFCANCLLFGTAAIMFEQSHLWDLTWWGGHFLLLVAYSIALWFVVLTIRREQAHRISISSQLWDANRLLEHRVGDRTRELTRLASNLRRANESLTQSNEEFEQFAYVAAHDIQELLRTVASFGDHMRDECGQQLTDGGRRSLDMICKSSERLKELVSDLLTVSRLSTDAALAATDADECLRDTINRLELALKDNDATVTNEVTNDRKPGAIDGWGTDPVPAQLH